MMAEKFRAMGTDVQITIGEDAGPSQAGITEAIEDAKTKVSELEALLSRFQTTSEISQINAQPGSWITVRPETMEILGLSERAYNQTNGLFNPCLGTVLESLGYSVSFEEIHCTTPWQPVFQNPFIAPLHCPFRLDKLRSKVYLEPGFSIDLGGIGKGWIAKQAARVLQAHQIVQFLLSAGGDMICQGTNGDIPWCVSIADAFDPNNTVETLNISDLSLATSGTYRRKWVTGGQPVHHIIDPFLGMPVDSDIVSCSVIHDDLVEAEVLAKVALILGSGDGLKWLNRCGCKGWLFVKVSGEVVRSWS